MPLRFYKEGMDARFGGTEHDSIYLGQVSETPTDADIGEGNTAFYAKADGELYKRPYGGTESGIGSGSGGGDFNHQLTQTLDAEGNRIEDVGSLQTKSVSVTGAIDSEIYSDSFNTDTSSEWTTVSGTLTWDTDNGRLEMASSTRATTNQPDAGSGVYTTTIISMESDTGNIGVIWAVQDDGTYYHARINPGANEVQLFSFDGGSPTLLGSSSVEITPGTPYLLSVVWDADSGTIEIYLDSDPQLSSPIITAQDTTHGTGGFGIRSYDGKGYIESISYNPEIPSEATTTILTPESVSTSDIQAGQGDVSGVFSVAGGVVSEQRGAPTTDELEAGERMQYTSDGSDEYSAGDLVSARNDSGTIVSQVIVAAADDT